MQDIYKHLRSYGLFKQKDIERRLAKFPKRKISKFLETYLEIAAERPLALHPRTGALDIYPDSWATPLPLTLIRQFAIYANRIYLHDPLVKMAIEWQELNFHPALVVMYPSEEERIAHFVKNLASMIERLLTIRPLVQAGIIHIAPTELVQHERSLGHVYGDQLFGPEGSFIDISNPEAKQPEIPPQFLEYFERNLVVSPAQFNNREPIVLDTKLDGPRRMIAIQFIGDPLPKFYQLGQMMVHEDTEAERTRFTTLYEIVEQTPVDPNTFWHWVEGSKRQVINERMGRLENDLLLAFSANAQFITNLPVSRDLAQLDLQLHKDDNSIEPINALLQLDLPFFDRVGMHDIVRARENEIAFEEFRIALHKSLEEIGKIDDLYILQHRVNEISRDLLMLPLQKIERQIQVLKRNLLLDAVVLIGTLAASIVTKNTLVGAVSILAAQELAKTYKQSKAEEDKIKQLPNFFYWDLTRKVR